MLFQYNLKDYDDIFNGTILFVIINCEEFTFAALTGKEENKIEISYVHTYPHSFKLIFYSKNPRIHIIM